MIAVFKLKFYSCPDDNLVNKSKIYFMLFLVDDLQFKGHQDTHIRNSFYFKSPSIFITFNICYIMSASFLTFFLDIFKHETNLDMPGSDNLHPIETLNGLIVFIHTFLMRT